MANSLVCNLSIGQGKTLTLALALLQFVQALGVTESGTFLFLPADVVGLRCLDV